MGIPFPLHEEQERYEDDFALRYVCTHCKSDGHVFALSLQADETPSVLVSKFGQSPPRGGPLPSAILNLAGRETKDLLRKGLECERHSLGVGAFAYYRKAFEGMRGEIFREVESISLSPTQRKAIESAINEPRVNESFRKAAPALATAFPGKESNPLTLLYSALSIGIHSGSTDEECLAYAKSALLAMTGLLTGIKDLKAARRQTDEAHRSLAEFVAQAKTRKSAGTKDSNAAASKPRSPDPAPE